MKFVRDLQKGDQIILVIPLDLEPLGKLYRPITLTVKHCVMMRDDSGDYAVAAISHDGHQWTNRITGDEPISQPDDAEVNKLQASFDRARQHILDEYEKGTLSQTIAIELLKKEISSEHD